TVVFVDVGEIVLRGLKTGADSGQLALKAALPEILPDMEGEYPWILTIMHSDLEETDAALELVRNFWAGPTGVYPNSGRFTDGYGWDHRTVCTPGEFVRHAQVWTDQGVGFIGGCCGIGPDHIRALANRDSCLDARQ
ncbi:MAG: homocysteine S-methyltransferase family protein, partial [Pseudomonadota bacterium]